MAKFGGFVFGSTLYGTGAIGPQPAAPTGEYQWTLLIRWGSDWVNEAGRCVAVSGGAGRQFYVGKNGTTFEPIQPGQMYFTLDNYDGRYDPYNSSSPLYGHIRPGRAVQFRTKVVANSHKYDIFAGRISDIVPISGGSQAYVTVVDAMQWLADQDITIPVAYNLTVDQAITHTLLAAKYPYPTAIGASACPITYFDPDAANALDTLRQLTDAGIGTCFVDRSGIFRYYDLTKTGIPGHTLDQSILLKEISVGSPWETVRNRVTTTANRFGYGTLQEVWRLDEPIVVAAHSTKTLNITFDAAQVVQPVAYTDYNSYSNSYMVGGVVNWTQTFTVYLSNITSTSATVNMQNTDGLDAYLLFLVIHGTSIIGKKITFSANDDVSANDENYGPRAFKIDSPWLQDMGFAAAYAPLLLAHLKDPTKAPVIEIETREDGFGIELLDRVTLTSAKLGISETFDVGRIEFQWLEETGQSFKHTLYLQNILYSTATITPQPYYPTLPPVPPVTQPPTTPTDPTTGVPLTCLDPAGGGGPTGPVGWGAVSLNNTQPNSNYAVQRWFRPIYHKYYTYLDIDGLWEQLIGDVWTPDDSFDFDSITAYGSQGQVVATGHSTGTGAKDGIRRYLFDNTKGVYVDHLVLDASSQTAEAFWPGTIDSMAIACGPGENNQLTVTNDGLFSDTVGGGTHIYGGFDFSATSRYGTDAEMRAGIELYIPDGPAVDFQGSVRITNSNYDAINVWYWIWHNGGEYGHTIDQYAPGPAPDYLFRVQRNFFATTHPSPNTIQLVIHFVKIDRAPVTGTCDFEFVLQGFGEVKPYKRITIRSINLFNFCEGGPGDPV